MSFVNVDNLVYAVLTKDSKTELKYEAVISIEGTRKINLKPGTSTAKLFGDGMVKEQENALDGIEVEIETTSLSLEDEATLTGAKIDKGIKIDNSDDDPPYVAVGFRSKKGGSKGYRYIWLLKGKFSPTEESYETKEDKAKFGTPTIKGTFVQLTHNGNWKHTGDDDAEGWETAAAETWFTSVPGQTKP